MNICLFIGNMTADPELRYGQSGTPITNFSIAINERTKDGKEVTEYIDVICWDKLAETVAEFARKGRKVAVQAQYHLERWEDNDGTKRSKPRFRARNVEFLDKPPQDQQQRPQQAQRPSQPSRSAAEDAELDQLPF